MSIEYVSFDKEYDDPKNIFNASGDHAKLLLELAYLLQKIQQEGMSIEYESKVTISQVKKVANTPINTSKILFIKMLHENSEKISSYIKDEFTLEEEIVPSIDGFLSEYTNENESSLDTVKSVREKIE